METTYSTKLNDEDHHWLYIFKYLYPIYTLQEHKKIIQRFTYDRWRTKIRITKSSDFETELQHTLPSKPYLLRDLSEFYYISLYTLTDIISTPVEIYITIKNLLLHQKLHIYNTRILTWNLEDADITKIKYIYRLIWHLNTVLTNNYSTLELLFYINHIILPEFVSYKFGICKFNNTPFLLLCHFIDDVTDTNSRNPRASTGDIARESKSQADKEHQ